MNGPHGSWRHTRMIWNSPEHDLDIYGREYPRRPGSKRPLDIPIEFWNYAGLTGAQQHELIRTYEDRCVARRKAKICRLRREAMEVGPKGTAAAASLIAQWFGLTPCESKTKNTILDKHEYRFDDGNIVLDFKMESLVARQCSRSSRNRICGQPTFQTLSLCCRTPPRSVMLSLIHI